MSNTPKINAVLALSVTFMFCAAIFGIKHKTTALKSQCSLNLRGIAACKQQWARDNHKTTNDTPTWDDLKPYVEIFDYLGYMTNGIPHCPNGGTYAIGRVGQPPTCTLGGPDHSISN